MSHLPHQVHVQYQVDFSKLDEIAVENYLDCHPEFFEDYFLRKANKRLVDKWLVCRTRSFTMSASSIQKKDLLTTAGDFQRTISDPQTLDSCDRSWFLTSTAAGKRNSSTSSAIRKVSSELHTPLDDTLTPILSQLSDGRTTFITKTTDTLTQAQPNDSQLLELSMEDFKVNCTRKSKSASELKLLSEESLIQELILDIYHEVDVEKLCHKILRNVCFLIDADRCSLFLVRHVTTPEGQQDELVSNLFDVTFESTLEEALKNDSIIRVPFGRGFVGTVAETGKALRIDDAYSDPRFTPNIDKMTGYKTKCVLTLPVKDHTGRVIGVTQAVNKKSSASQIFSEKDQQVFELFLTFCGIGIRNAQLYRKSQMETKRNQVLLDLSRIILEHQNCLEPLMRKILQYMQVLTQSEWCQIMLLDDPAESTHIFDQIYELKMSDDLEHNCSSDEEPSSEKLLFSSDITRYVCHTGLLLNIPNASEDARLTELERIAIRSLLCIPIKNSANSVVGVCTLLNRKDRKPFSTTDQQLAEAFALFCGLGIQNSKMFERVELLSQRQKVALDVLSYHAVAKKEDSTALAKSLVPSAKYFKLLDFEFNDLSLSENETLLCSIKMFTDLGLLRSFKIDYNKFCRWVLSVKRNYRQVTYHNWRHALNVTQTMFAMLKHSSHLKKLDNLTRLALLIACICHDLDHRGLDNKFQQITQTPLAQLYSSSMLEHHHFHQCIMLLNIKDCDILSSLNQEQYERCIKLVEKCILDTDLARHFSARNRIKDIIHKTGFSWSNPEHCDMLMGLMMTGSDLNAITKPWKIQYKTAHLVASEFYEQGDIEREKLNLQPEDLKNREKRENLPSLQVGFIDFVCKPVYEFLAHICDDLDPLLNGCLENRHKWQDLIPGQSNEDNK